MANSVRFKGNDCLMCGELPFSGVGEDEGEQSALWSIKFFELPTGLMLERKSSFIVLDTMQVNSGNSIAMQTFISI